MVRTSGFHPGNGGSIPPGVTRRGDGTKGGFSAYVLLGRTSADRHPGNGGSPPPKQYKKKRISLWLKFPLGSPGEEITFNPVFRSCRQLHQSYSQSREAFLF